jgi:tRNA threonylcarbamoyladenosine modification (KEOPS) complex Cgi121 subunit
MRKGKEKKCGTGQSEEKRKSTWLFLLVAAAFQRVQIKENIEVVLFGLGDAEICLFLEDQTKFFRKKF